MVESVQIHDAARLDRSRESEIEDARDPTNSFGVLLVDDNHHHRIPLLAALRKQGYRVLHAAGGDSAEAICRTSQHPVHVVVTREEMKRMNGPELARRLTGQRPDIQVLLMRRQPKVPATDEVEPTSSLENPGSAVIEDPFTPADLCNRVSELIASTRHRNAESVHVIA